MKKLVLILAGIALLGFYAWSSFASPQGAQTVKYVPAEKDCFESSSEGSNGNTGSSSGRSFKYCVHRAKQGTNGNIAYLLHGRNLDEHTWNDDTFYTSLIQKYWAAKNVKPPVIVSVSFGPIWLLTPKMSLEKTGLLENFVNNVIPLVESRAGVPQERLVFGESMGGFNSLALALQTKNLFKKAAALCPVIYLDSPFASLDEIQRFLKRTGADPKIIYGVRTLGREYVANEAEWNRISPVQVLKSVNSSDLPEIYLSCGLYDRYGNFEGTEFFAEDALKRGARLSWHPLYGGHCAIDVVSLADFLAK